MLWPLSVVLVANTNGRLAIPALAGLLVHAVGHFPFHHQQPIYNIKRSTVNVYKIDSGRSVWEEYGLVPIFALTAWR